MSKLLFTHVARATWAGFVLVLTAVGSMTMAHLAPAVAASGAADPDAATISGTVIDQDGEPVADAVVSVIQMETGYYPTSTQATTNAQGAYSITATWGWHRVKVRVQPPAGLATTFYGGRSSTSAPWVAVGSGATVAGVDVQVSPGGSIAGHVTAPTTWSAGDLTTYVYNDDDRAYPVGSSPVDPVSGDYRVDDLPAGDLKVALYSTTTGVVTWYGAVSNFAQATPVPATVGGTASGVDLRLPTAGHLRGTVVGAGTGAAPRYAEVAVYAVEDLDNLVRYGEVDRGRLIVDGLAPGDYRLRVTNSEELAPQWFPTDVTVQEGATTTLPEVALEERFTCTANPTITNLDHATDSSTRAVPGERLSASPAYWSKTPTTVTVQWLRNGEPIPGAEGSSYTPTNADLGQRLVARAEASRPGFAGASCDSQQTDQVKPALQVVRPVGIGGERWIYGTVVAEPATWSVQPDSVSYQWFVGTTQWGPPSSTFTIPFDPVDLDNPRVSVRATASKAGYAPQISEATATLLLEENAATAAPVPPRGTPLAGKILSIDPSRLGWQHPVQDVRIQWMRDGMPVPSAVKPTYRLTGSDAGALMSVRVTPVSGCCRPVPWVSTKTSPVKVPTTLAITGRSTAKHKLLVTVTYRPVDGHKPLGCVVVHAGAKGKCVRLSRSMTAQVLFNRLKSGKVAIRAAYAGDRIMAAGTSPRRQVRVR